jgi:hypothetical protein
MQVKCFISKKGLAQEYMLRELKFKVGICHLINQEEQKIETHVCILIACEISQIRFIVM